MQHSLAESIPGILKRLKIRALATQPAGGFGSLESILGLLKSLKNRGSEVPYESFNHAAWILLGDTYLK
jgi:hypothetical protein